MDTQKHTCYHISLLTIQNPNRLAWTPRSIKVFVDRDGISPPLVLEENVNTVADQVKKKNCESIQSNRQMQLETLNGWNGRNNGFPLILNNLHKVSFSTSTFQSTPQSVVIHTQLQRKSIERCGIILLNSLTCRCDAVKIRKCFKRIESWF